MCRVRTEPLAEVGLEGADLAQPPFRDERAHPDDVREEAGPHRLHQEGPAGSRGSDQVTRPSGVGRERLLDQDGLAGVDGQ